MSAFALRRLGGVMQPLPGNPMEVEGSSTRARHAAPTGVASPWERLKIGAGTPPVLTRHGWLIVYRGVSCVARTAREADTGSSHLCYAAGVMILSEDHPQQILYRSTHPVLEPETPAERSGTIADVVFPTGIDRRDDLGRPDRFDVYDGMADSPIGVPRLDLPEILPDDTPRDRSSTV